MDNGKIIIRRAKTDDIPEIIKIERDIFDDPWERDSFYEAIFLFPGLFFVAIKNSHIAGFLTAGIEDTGEEKYGHIMNIGTGKNYQREGIGSQLIKRLEYELILLGVSAIQLEVRVSNTGAQEFYRRLGFCDVFVIAEYYSDGEDALLMGFWFD